MERNRPLGRAQRAPSPHMLRSKSTSTGISIPEPKPCQAQLEQRSKSTTRTAPLSGRNDESKIHSNRFKSQRSPSHYSISSDVSSSKTNKTVSRSKSAWALSPGRSLAPDHSRKKSVTSETKSVSGGVSKVLKYFKTKKASPMTEQEFHNFRMLHNRLVQWRFANAKAEAAVESICVQAENKVFSVWLKTLKARNTVMEKRIMVQKHEQQTKLAHIVNPQICLLDEWMRIEKRNFEALSRLARKLSAVSVHLPLCHGAKGDVPGVYDSMTTAMDILEILEECIPKLLSQVEITYSLLHELTITAEQERKCLKEISHWIATLSSLEATERSVRICLIRKIEETMFIPPNFDTVCNINPMFTELYMEGLKL